MNKTTTIIIAVIVLVVLLAGAVFIFSGKSKGTGSSPSVATTTGANNALTTSGIGTNSAVFASDTNAVSSADNATNPDDFGGNALDNLNP